MFDSGATQTPKQKENRRQVYRNEPQEIDEEDILFKHNKKKRKPYRRIDTDEEDKTQVTDSVNIQKKNKARKRTAYIETDSSD